MSVYEATYGALYGSSGGTFPEVALGAGIDLDVGGWTDITAYAVEQDYIAASIQRGRQNETTSLTPSQCPMRWNNIDARFDPENPVGPYFGLLGLNTPVRVSVPDSGTYLRFADDQASYCSTPSSAGLNPSGDIEWQLDLRLTSWMPCVLASKDDADTERSWSIRLNGDGTIALYWFTTGSAANLYSSTAPLPYGRISLRITLAVASGTVTWYTSTTPIDESPTWTQLGAQAVAGATSLFDSTTAVAVGANAAITALDATAGVTTIGPAGKVYGFQLLSGIGGTIKASPDFTTATAGASTFTDGQSNVWTVNGTAEFSSRNYRYHGECSSLPEEWDPTGNDIWVPCGASGVARRLQQGNSPILSVMRRAITSYPSGPSSAPGGATGPQSTIGYWSCEDGQGSASFASGISQNADGLVPQPMQFTGTPSIQAQTGSPQADSVFACSAQLPQVGTSRWTANVPSYNTASSAFMLLFLLTIPSAGISADADLLDVSFPSPGFATFAVSLNYATGSNGSLTLSIDGTPTSAITGVNGVAYWVAISNVGTGTATAQLSLLEVGTDTVTSVSGLSDAGNVSSFTVNPSAANLGETEMGQFWVSAQWSSGASVPAAPDIGLLYPLAAAYAGETAGARFSRLCGENGLQTRIYGPPDNSCVMGPQQIDTLMNVFQSCEDADRGQIYEPRDVLGLGYRVLSSLQNQSPAVSADYSLGVVSPPLRPTRDDLLIRNDNTISRNNGSSVQVQVTTGPMSVQPPPAGVGDYTNSLTTYNAYDWQLPYIAGWMSWVGTAPGKRYPVMFFDLASTDPNMQDLLPYLRDADIGDYLQITNTPQPLLPPGDIDQLAYGMKEDIGDFIWRIQFNAVPESPYEVATAGTDTADSALAESSGTVLATGYSSTATSFSVDVTGPVWVTGTVSFSIMVAGEEIEVTDISGATSPQTFTVTRSVNGVVKAQASGAAITLADEPIAALAA
jgi:hypothetical protein